MSAVGAERKFKPEFGAGRCIARQSSAERLYPLAHPAHSVGFEVKAPAALVFSLQNTTSILRLKPQAAVLSLRMAYYVGHGFAHDQRDHAFLRIGHRHFRSVRLQSYAGTLQHRLRALHLFTNLVSAVAAEGVPYLGH